MGIGGDYSSSQLDACLHVCYISQLFKPLRGKQRERAGVERLGTPASLSFSFLVLQEYSCLLTRWRWNCIFTWQNELLFFFACHMSKRNALFFTSCRFLDTTCIILSQLVLLQDPVLWKIKSTTQHVTKSKQKFPKNKIVITSVG